VLECCLRLGLEKPPTELCYKPIPLEMQAGVQMALTYINGWQQRNPFGQVWPEEQLNAQAFFDGHVAGTTDVVLQTAEEIEIVDLKYGRVQVDAEENTQMQLYGVAAVCERKMVWPERFTFTIIQPRGARFPIDSWTVNAKDIHDWAENTVKPIVQIIKIQGMSAPRVAGTWCRYCRVKGNCQTYYDAVFKGITHEDRSSA
jgi:hypothetical protein